MCVRASTERKSISSRQLQIKDGDGEETETRLVPMLREYAVFNVHQCENLPDTIRAGKPMRVRNPDTRDALADEFLRSTGADIREGQKGGCTAGWRDRELGRFDAYIYSMGKLHFDRTDYSIVVKNRAPFRIRGGGGIIAPGDQTPLSSHRSTFPAWRRPIGPEKKPPGNYCTNYS